MVTLGEGYRALGAGMERSYRSRADELKDFQRRQLLTAALTPIAQGVGQFATDLISAPFKEAATSFYNRGAGRGLNAKLRVYQNGLKTSADRNAKINEQGHDQYYSFLNEQYDKAYEDKMRAELGESYNVNNPIYVEGLGQLETAKRAARQQEYDEHIEEYNMYLNAASPEEIDRVVKKYNPNPKNLGSYVFKKAYRAVRGISTEEAEDAALTKMQSHFLNEYGLDLSDEGIKKIKEVRSRGTNAYFNPEVVKSLPMFKSPEYVAASEDYKERLNFQAEARGSNNGGYIALFEEAQSKNPNRLVSQAEVESLVTSRFGEIVGADLKDSQAAFRDTMQVADLPTVLKEQIKGMTSAEQKAELVKISDGVYSAARMLVQDEYLNAGVGSSLSFTSLDKVKFTKRVDQVARALFSSDLSLDVLKEPMFGGSPKGRIQLMENLSREMSANPIGADDRSTGTDVRPRQGTNVLEETPQPTVVGALDLRDPNQEQTVNFMREGLGSIISNDTSPAEKLTAFRALEQEIKDKIKTAQGLPDNAVLPFIYPDALQEQIDSLEPSTNYGYLNPVMGGASIIARELQKLDVSKIPTGYSMAESIGGLRSDMQQRALEERGRGPSEVELQRRREYENRSSSEAFGDTEMGREMSPLGQARSAYRSNLREPFQNIGRVRSLLDSEDTPDSEPSSSVLSGNIQDVAKRALNAIGVRVEPKSPERVAEIMQQRAEAIEAYEAARKNKSVEQEPTIIDSFIDFFIPGAQASKVIEEEEARPVSQIGAIANRQQQKEVDRWENKKTMDISGVVRGGKKVTIGTTDPVSFIRNSDLTPTESIALYYTALKEHANERPSAKSYAMKPLTQAMLWTYEAMPEEVEGLERVFTTRLQSREMASNVLSIVNSDNSQSEIDSYSARVSQMSKGEKETEYKRQLRVAKKVPTETDEDYARNAIEYLKLQSIFGEDDDRIVTSGGRSGKTTVNDKVDEYYTNMLQFDSPAYDKQTQLYANVLLQISPISRPSSLLAQN
tara:strand:+ start:24 stop:3065 length:3042 start_codon:yes stop_codon:yes gene_type:complete